MNGKSLLSLLLKLSRSGKGDTSRKEGKPVYSEIVVFPVVKELREKLYGEFEKEYAGKKSKKKGDKEPGKKADRSHNYKDPEKGKDAVVR